MSYLVYVEQADEIYSPPEKLLGVAIVGDRIFLSIEEYEETYDTRSLKTIAQISVSKAEIAKAFVAADNSLYMEKIGEHDPR